MTRLERLNLWLELNEDIVPNAQELYDAAVEALNL
jgi:hypothetical protein|tara:strand:+ start:316 stop:420 length:105 start_codon:yes stop_codon:yes gene_type:complete